LLFDVGNGFFFFRFMDQDSLLQKIERYAAHAHGEQTRRYSPDLYIVHPIRVMEKCRLYLPQTPVLAAALLHDVLEDTSVTAEELEGFLYHTMEAEDARLTMLFVVELTDIYTRKAYPRFNRRKRRDLEFERLAVASPEAQTIKYADIIDNTDITENDPDFAQVYLREALRLLKKMTAGNPMLYQEALDTVETCLRKLDGRAVANDGTVQFGEKS
jgi:guanosine-3',5'-bis(diphosphate) 3'-pyrophosphohydrolase